MPRATTQEADSTTGAAPDNGAAPASKYAAVGLALEALGGKKAKPMDIRDWLLDKYNIDMPTSHISNYKSSILKDRKGKGGRPRKVRPEEPAGAFLPPPAPARGAIVTFEDLRYIKELAERIGTEKLVELVELVGR